MSNLDTPNKEDKQLHACPFCGGTSGFYWKFADLQIQFCEWNGKAIECNNDFPLFTRKMRCTDCKHIVEKELEGVRITTEYPYTR